jgi:TPR repeat protein
MTGPAATFNIMGCCCSRNVFNVCEGESLAVEGYIQRQNPLLVLQKPHVILDDDMLWDFVKYLAQRDQNLALQFCHGFNRRMLRMLVNCEAVDTLLNRKGEYLLIDTYYFQGDKIHILDVDGEKTMMAGGYARMLPRLKKSGLLPEDAEIYKLEACPNYVLLADRFCEFVRDNWGDKVVLLNSMPCGYMYDSDLGIREMDFKEDAEQSEFIFELLREKLGCHCITLPETLISRDGDPVHYVDPITDYIKHSLDCIVLGKGSGEIENAKQECSETIRRMKNGEFYDEQTAWIWFKGQSKSSDADIARVKTVLDKLIAQGSAIGWMGYSSLYRTGNGVGLDLKESERCAKIASGIDAKRSISELFNILWAENTPESLKELKEALDSLEPIDNARTLKLRFRLYSSHRISFDKKIAKDCLRRAVELDRSTLSDYVNYLWKIGDNEEAFLACRRYSEDFKDGDAMLRLSYMLSEGIGTEKDPDESSRILEEFKAIYPGRDADFGQFKS